MDDRNKAVNLKYKCIDDLQPLFERNFKKFSMDRLLSTCQKCRNIEKAEEFMKIGDYESAYVQVMLFANMMSHITDSPAYKKDKKFYNLMIGPQYKKAVDLAEKIKQILVPMYEDAETRNNQNVNEMPLPPAAAPTSEIISVPEKDEVLITCANLFTMIKEQKTKILLMDTRSPQDYKESHNKAEMLLSVINIPESNIRRGMSAHNVERALPQESLEHWKQRGSFDRLVVIGYDSESDSAKILRDILKRFDRVAYQRDILIIAEGFNGFEEFYPWFLTNPTLKKTRAAPTFIEDNLSQVDFDLDIDFKVEHDEAKPYFSRATKPSFAKNKTSIPSVDRSAKAAAVKTYAERREAVAELMRQKEVETKAVLEVERERFRREKALQEDLRRQKELEIDEERRAIMVEEGEKMVMELEELKNEAKSKDAMIRALQKQIENLEIISDATKQPTNEEKEIGARIKSQEEQTKVIKHECDNLEKEQELERKRLEDAVRNKRAKEVIPQRQIKKTDPTPPQRPVPFVNRTTKPKPIVDDRPPIIGKAPGLTGLKNLGNTCYMNSILQCISNHSELAKFFREAHYLEHLNRSHRTRGEVAEKVAEVVKALWSGTYRFVGCEDFKNTVGSIRSEYKSYDQQDSHEFLTFLMDWLHNDLKKEDSTAMDIESTCEMDKAWKSFEMKNKSFISSLFYGLQRSTVTCLTCSERSSTYEPFSNLSLIIPEGGEVTLVECLQLYLKKELISGWRCPKCKVERQAEKKTELCKLPVILVIHLKRFSFLEVQSQKRTTVVDFTLENLRLDGSGEQRTYNLYGVSNHYGTMEGGHYTAYCKSPRYDKWYKFDDHEVAELSPSDVRRSGSAAYILFYNSTKSNLGDQLS